MKSSDVHAASALRAMLSMLYATLALLKKHLRMPLCRESGAVLGITSAKGVYRRRNEMVGTGAKGVLIACAVIMAGCGSVEWFPPYVRLSTTPDQFSFAAKTGTAVSTQVTSDPITVSGLTGDSSPISITGSVGSNSKYAINAGTATDAAGTVKNGDQVTVTHTSSSVLGTSTISTLSIGNVNGQFISTTQLVQVPLFTTPIQSGSFMQADATIFSFDGIVGTHAISIKDSLTSGNAAYSIADENGNITFFTNIDQIIPVLNGRRIFVRNQLATILTPATTTLTIDGVEFTVNLTPP